MGKSVGSSNGQIVYHFRRILSYCYDKDSLCFSMKVPSLTNVIKETTMWTPLLNQITWKTLASFVEIMKTRIKNVDVIWLWQWQTSENQIWFFIRARAVIVLAVPRFSFPPQGLDQILQHLSQDGMKEEHKLKKWAKKLKSKEK